MNKIHINDFNYKYKKEGDKIIGLLPFRDVDEISLITLETLQKWVKNSTYINQYYFTPCENFKNLLNKYNETNTVENTSTSYIRFYELLKEYENKIVVINDGSAYSYRIDIKIDAVLNPISLNVSDSKLKKFMINDTYKLVEILEESEFIPIMYRDTNLDNILNILRNNDNSELIKEYINSPYECLRKISYISLLKNCRDSIIKSIDYKINNKDTILKKLKYIDEEIVKNTFEFQKLLDKRKERYTIG